MEKYSSVTVLSRVPLLGTEFGLVAQQLPMKSCFQEGSPMKAQGKDVYPLLNLDIFVQINGKPEPIVAEEADKLKLAVTVVIPDSFVKRITAQHLARAENLMFWDGNLNKWISLKECVNKKEVSPIVAGQNYVYFEIYQWPVGDRLIGCY
jgi:hypothetical protein